MSEAPAFLNVEASLTGRRWLGPDIETERQAETMAQQTGLAPALCRTLARLGVTAMDAPSYLEPSLRDLLPDPRSLRDMETAATRFLQAAQSGQRIAVFADYDVDGGTSGALLIHWLRELGYPVDHRATLYVPDRIDEGYGPNAPAIAELASNHDLIVCVDCGTLSHDALAAAGDTDVVVLDHHLGGETLPDVHAVVNPNRQDESGDLAHLCAAAIVFLMLVEVGRQMREAGNAGPNLLNLLDFVALATVADVAPLIGVNRAFVRQGLKVLAQRRHAGLVALADSAGMDGPPTSYHLGFLLGPRINAGGRIGKADLGARLLATVDPQEASAMAAQLEILNRERREIENLTREVAMDQAQTRLDAHTPENNQPAALAWAADDGWHPGVVGIVASRMKEATNLPAIVIGFDGDAGKGSGRSVSGVDLGHAIQKLVAEGLLEKGGGHKMAAGLSLTRAQLEPAMIRLEELLAKQGAGLGGPAALKLDAMLMPGAAQTDLVAKIESAGPFGAGAPGPRFAFASQKIFFAKRVGESHLKISFGDGMGPRIDAICFGAFDGAIGPTLQNHNGALFHLAGRLEINRWQGRESVQLRLEDVAEA